MDHGRNVCSRSRSQSVAPSTLSTKPNALRRVAAVVWRLQPNRKTERESCRSSTDSSRESLFHRSSVRAAQPLGTPESQTWCAPSIQTMWTRPEAHSTQAGRRLDENIYPAQVAVFARLYRRLTFQNRELAASIHGSGSADTHHDLAPNLSENVCGSNISSGGLFQFRHAIGRCLSSSRMMFVIIANNVCHHKKLRTSALP